MIRPGRYVCKYFGWIIKLLLVPATLIDAKILDTSYFVIERRIPLSDAAYQDH